MRRLDWRDAATYAWTEGLTPSQWAWEFLRRNPAYREAWDRHLKALDTMDGDESYSVGEHFFDELYADSEFGFAGLYANPQEDNPEIEWLPPVYVTPESGSDIPSDYQGGRVNISFNFLEPIKPQIDSAGAKLKRLAAMARKSGARTTQSFKPKGKIKNWTTLLRILDADAEEPKPSGKEIAKVIFPSKCLVDGTSDRCPFDTPGTDFNDPDDKCPESDKASGKERCYVRMKATSDTVSSKRTKQALRKSTTTIYTSPIRRNRHPCIVGRNRYPPFGHL